jgi:hypothetical protein
VAEISCPPPSIYLGPDIIQCEGSPVTLDASHPGSTYLWSTSETTPAITITSSGDYWVQVTNLCGSVTKDTIKISFIAPPNIELGNNPSVCKGDKLPFTIANPNNFVFSWYHKDINTSSSPIYSLTLTDYGKTKLKVVATKGQCIVSDSIQITVKTALACNPSLAYCIPVYTTGTGTGNYIKTVKINTLNNSNSGNIAGPSYTDYYNTHQTNLTAGATYEITTEFAVTSRVFYGVYIDFNQDGTFAEYGEKIDGNVASTNNGISIITLPANIPSGPTRMRVRLMDYISERSDPCYSATIGETEDYKIIISPKCPDISLTATLVDEFCEGGNGSIDISVLNGIAPFTYSWSNHAISEDLKLLSSGTYTIITTDVNGCKSDPYSWNIKKGNRILNVVVETLPAKENVCDGITMVNASSPTGSITYSWDKGLSPTFYHTGLCPGLYNVTVNDNLGCSITKEVLIKSSIVSADKNSNEIGNLGLYPNPLSGEILYIDLPANEEKVLLSLLTLSGMVLKSEEVSSLNAAVNKISLPVNDINPGTYILSILSKNGVSYRKIVKL